MSDILDKIDAAVGCHHCHAPLGESPSDDFCSEKCQDAWRAARVGIGEIRLPEEMLRRINRPSGGAITAPPANSDVVPILLAPGEVWWSNDGENWRQIGRINEDTGLEVGPFTEES